MQFARDPEELRKMMEAQQDRHMMEASAFIHGVERLFNELGKDDLLIVRELIKSCSNEYNSAYFDGQVSSYVKVRFGICASCGVNHDEEQMPDLFQGTPLTDELIETIKQVGMKGSIILPNDDEFTVERPVYSEDNPLHLDEVKLTMMKEYHLEDAWDADTKVFLGFACTGVSGSGPCGMIYQSIEDRMLREKDQCSGCSTKSRWG